MFGSIRHEHHLRRARLRPWPIPDRLRHRGCAQRACRPRCRGQRGLPSHDPRRSVPERPRKRTRGRPRTRSLELPLLRHVQRPGRQRLAVSGGHQPAARAHRLRRDFLRLGERSGGCTAASGSRTRRAREASRPARRALAGMVRRLPRGGAVRRGKCPYEQYGAIASGSRGGN
jgi:hypothetical protein